MYTLWCDGLSCHVQCLHLTWVFIQYPAHLLLIQFPGKAAENILIPYIPAPFRIATGGS